MSLQQWLNNGWLKTHRTTREEIGELLAIVDRDLSDAGGSVSPDWQFGIAYNAALKLCTVLVYAEGYRAERTLHHYRTLQALPLVLGRHRQSDADYLDTCRVKRNTAEYDYVGGVSEKDVEDLRAFVRQLRVDVLEWLRSKHPELILPGDGA
jgi:hypothetical protein